MMICCLHVVLGAAAGVVAVCMHACMCSQLAPAWLPGCLHACRLQQRLVPDPRPPSPCPCSSAPAGADLW
jgi:hypothetical protein